MFSLVLVKVFILVFWFHFVMEQGLSITKHNQIQIYKDMVCDQGEHKFLDRLLTGLKQFLEIAEKHIVDQGF